jgi:glycosyltransferase involved in cell wall biosynthesis
MKIGFFTSNPNGGGSEAYLLDLMIGVRLRGHTPVLFGVKGSELFDNAIKENIECVVCSVVNVKNHNPNKTSKPNKVDKAINEKATDKSKLLANLYKKLLPQNLKLLIGQTRNVFYLRKKFKEHVLDIMHVNMSGYEVAGLACQTISLKVIGLQHIMPPAKSKLDRTHKFLIKFTAKRYDKFVSVSEAALIEWKKLCLLDEEKSIFILNGINVNKFLEASKNRVESSKPYKFLIVGRIEHVKGIDVLMDSLEHVKNNNIIIDIAGDGSFYQSLVDKVQTNSLYNCIKFLGHVIDVAQLYPAYDCLLIPSRTEGCPYVLLEGMASGLPVISSDQGPLPFLNEHNHTGLVFNIKKPSELADAIDKISGNTEVGLLMGQKAQQKALAEFTIDRMIDETLATYKSVIAHE